MIILKDKFIYLDWNVFKYLKDNKESEFSKRVNSIKENFKVPYSFAHLCDLQKNYNSTTEKFVRSDLEFLEKCSEGYMIGIFEDDYDLSNENDIYGKFDEVSKFNKLDTSYNLPKDQIDKITLEIENIGFKEFFKGKECLFPLVIKQALSRFNADYKLYKLHRDFILNSFSESEEGKLFDELKGELLDPNKFKQCVDLFLKYSAMKNTESMRIGVGYCLLDYNRNYKEKITKKSHFPNIYNDGEHLKCAKHSEMYITLDRATKEKSQYLFKVFEINTPIYTIDDFLKIKLEN